MKLRYGMILGMKGYPTLRAMCVAPVSESQIARGLKRGTWSVIVLRDDDPNAWAVGSIQTANENENNLVIEETE